MKKNKNSSKVRVASDSMGKIYIPKDALYGAQTQRAINNFPISGITFNKHFISSVVINLLFIGSNIRTFFLNSCIKSLSDETIVTFAPFSKIFSV